ncbi:MAG: penicillin-binding protein 2 [bacterium]
MKDFFSNRYRLKAMLVMVVFACGYASVTYRLYTLQVRDHALLRDMADKQHKCTLEIVPKRGTVYDAKMRELAISVDTVSVYAVPPKVKDKTAAAGILAKITGEDRRKILRELLKTKRQFVWVARKLNPEIIEKLDKANLDGVSFLYESRRFYPNRTLASGLLGFVGLDNQGLEGIEFQYDNYIKGESGWFIASVDARRRKIMAEVKGYVEPSGANHLVLTIDKVIQYVAEEELKKAVLENKALSGMAVMMRPSTGEILAMASYPVFNPNEFQDSRPQDRKNLGIIDAFEPGSTFKLITLSTALDQGAVRPDDIFFCENGAYHFRTTVYHDTHEYGWLSVGQVLQLSSNIGAIKIGERLKENNFYSSIKNFGFGEKTRVDLPGESAGMVRPVSKWSGLSMASMSMGQEISVTALQLLTAVCTIANKGVRMQPYVVSQVINPDGKIVLENKPKVVRKVISDKTAEFMISSMEAVTSKEGTAPLAAIPGFRVGGKTGTAQKYDSAIGRYSNDKYVSSFVGVVPSRNPEIALIVVLNEPRGAAYYGGYVAAPAFRRIAERTLRYLRVAPEESPGSILSTADEAPVSIRKLSGSGSCS